MAWFPSLDETQAKSESTPPIPPTPPTAPPLPDVLLFRAQQSRAAGDVDTARQLAKAALDQSLRTHGERHPALVPFLLVYAGLLNQCQNWAAGKPFYERAQHLRGSVTPLR